MARMAMTSVSSIRVNPRRRVMRDLRAIPSGSRAGSYAGSIVPDAAGGGLRPLPPGAQVALLLGGEPVDLDPHRLELQARDEGVHLGGDGVDRDGELAAHLGDAFAAQGLDGEGHV